MQKGDKIVVTQDRFDALLDSHKNLQNRYDLLLHQLANLQREMFGSKSERYLQESLAQLRLDILAESQVVESKPVQQITINKPLPSKPKRKPLPIELPRVIKDIYPEGDLSTFKYIGFDASERLAITKPKLFVVETRRHKYAKPDGQGIIIAPLEESVLPKSIAANSLICYILASKFLDHLPFYRIISLLKRNGIDIKDSTLNDWQAGVIDNFLVRLYERVNELIIKCNYLQMDETHMKVLDKDNKGTTHHGYIWVCHAPRQKLVSFNYDPSRSSIFPVAFLKPFTGVLQTDAYPGYNIFNKHQFIELIGCMVHARRYFEKAKGNDKERAQYFLEQVRVLFDLEEKLQTENASDQEIVEARKNTAIPVLNHLNEWLKINRNQVLPQSPIGKAIDYALKNWEKLCRYTLNAELQLHNNLIENLIRPIAIGRKNYMFAGNHQGAQRAAIMYTLFANCKLNNINPEHWLIDVLDKIASRKANNIDDLLPHNWKPDLQDVV